MDFPQYQYSDSQQHMPDLLQTENMKRIQVEYGYKKKYVFFIRMCLIIRKFFYYLLQGNFFYILRGFFKFFFVRKNKEYIDS